MTRAAAVVRVLVIALAAAVAVQLPVFTVCRLAGLGRLASTVISYAIAARPVHRVVADLAAIADAGRDVGTL